MKLSSRTRTLLVAGMVGLFAANSVGAADNLRVRLVDRDGDPVPDGLVLIATAGTPPALESPNGLAVVDQKDKTFIPHVLAIAPGTSVSFPNSDDTRHHVYSFSEAKTFELRLYRANEAPPVKFDQPGIVSLGCNIHDNMKGYIYVTDNPLHGITDADGRATIALTGVTGPATLIVWHPQLTAAEERPLNPAGADALEISLPFDWELPQQGRKVSELENLLKRYRQ